MTTIPNPRLKQRKCGGFLALSPNGVSLRIGVLAPSRAEAREQFASTWAKWQTLLQHAK